MRKGDIVLVPFPFTDLSGQKVRPALVLHASVRGEDCIVAFISSVPRERVGRFEMALAPSMKNGLKIRSTLRLDKLATLEKKVVIGVRGALEAVCMRETEKRLRTLFTL